jgi:hypothetical protein
MPAIIHARFMRAPLSVGDSDSPEPDRPSVVPECVDWDADDTGAPDHVKNKMNEFRRFRVNQDDSM